MIPIFFDLKYFFDISLIKHLNNFKTRYAHLYKFSKGIKKGKVVKQGDIIGFVGTSGIS